VLTKNFTIFIKFWRFNAFFDEAFTVTSRSKTIAALRLCVLDGNARGIAFGNKGGKLPVLTIVNVALVYFIHFFHYQTIIIKCTIIIPTAKIHEV
jgi:hypothetical protein